MRARSRGCSSTKPRMGRATVAEPDAALLERGRVLRARALARAAGTLPAYEGATGYLTLTCPPWAQPQEEMEGQYHEI